MSVERPVSLIKCDVEHHELAVFEGADETLRRDKPVLLFESGNLLDGRRFYQPVFDHLESLGFVGHFFFEESLVPLSLYDPASYELPYHENQNYLFVHPERVSSDDRVAELLGSADASQTAP